MDKLIEGFTQILLQMGLPGLVIFALAYALIKMFRLYCNAQEKRIADVQSQISALNASSKAIEKFAELIEHKF